LPIAALPISSEAVTWFSRLGLLCLEDLRKLPPVALAARLESPGLERTLDLIQGRDNGVLAAHLPEELPLEEQSWDCPLESVEPLLFVLKGLAARLASRLEGRGQAAGELLLTIQYDRAIAALRNRERQLLLPDVCSMDEGDEFSRAISFKLATPLSHAEDLERIVRSRLQRETLLAPARGLRLQVTALTEAQQSQLGLGADAGLAGTLSADPRVMAVLVAELSADIGGSAVGLLEVRDSYLPEKSSCFMPMERAARASGEHERAHGRRKARHGRAQPEAVSLGGSNAGLSSGKATSSPAVPSGNGRPALDLPTRLVGPIELKVPLRENEIVVLGQCAYVIEAIQFEQRLEAVEWWEASAVSRDYFRLWLSSLAPLASGAPLSRLSPGGFSSVGSSSPGRVSPARSAMTCGVSAPSERGRRDGLAVLAFVNRDNGKRYVQAVFD
jgi:hypothetical protein